MKKLFRMILILCLVFSATLIVSAEDTTSVKLDLKDGDIDITPTGYTQGGEQEVAFTGDYIITGSRISNTPLDITNNSGSAVTFNITLYNAEIIGDIWCTALRIDGTSPITLNITNIGSSKIVAYNHPAIKSNSSSSVTVNITDSGDSSLHLDRSYRESGQPVVFGPGTNGTIEVTVNGIIPDNTHSLHAHSYTDYVADGNATCFADGTKTAKCSADASCTSTHTITDEGTKGHSYESGVCVRCRRHGVEITKNDIIWLKYQKDEKVTWFGLDNSNGIFENQSYFWVELADDTMHDAYWEQLDEEHKKSIEKENYILFQTGVTKPNGEEYTQFDQDTCIYVQLDANWDKDDLQAAYISSGADEVVQVSYETNMQYPEGTDNFGKLTLKHFSPYIVYDRISEADNPTNNNTPTDNDNQPKDENTAGNNTTAESQKDNTTESGKDSVPKTGDITSFSPILLWVISLIVIVFSAKRLTKNRIK